VRLLRDEVARGDDLIRTLKGAHGTFTDEEINAHIAAITARQQALKYAESEKRDELGALYTSPKSEHELIDMLQRAQHLQKVFVDTRDEKELSEIVYQLDYIIKDIRNWPGDEVSASRLDELLQSQSANQEKSFLSHLEEKDIEVAWCESIYQALSSEKIRKAYQCSKEWAEIRYFEKPQILALNEEKARSLQREISAMPTFLSDIDRERLQQMLETISTHLYSLEENKRREEVEDWFNQFEGVDINVLEQHEITRSLKVLSSPPHLLDKEQSLQVRRLEQQLQSTLDRISVADILQRIAQLPHEIQREIISTIETTLVKGI
ncbi:hypothetical protein M3899_004633, partial [Vibrio parahaemolyticus]|nr:hypothetical protein [Vibrio parahaemolyticus]